MKQSSKDFFKKVSVREFLYPLLIVYGILITSFLLTYTFPFDYFTNSAVEKHLIYLINRHFREFIYHLPSFFVIVGAFIFYFKKKPLVAMHLLLPIFMLHKSIINGILIIK